MIVIDSLPMQFWRKMVILLTKMVLYSTMIFTAGLEPNRFNLIRRCETKIKNSLIRKVNQNLSFLNFSLILNDWKKNEMIELDFDSLRSIIHFDSWFTLMLFILIRVVIDSSRITIHPSSLERWIMILLLLMIWSIRYRIKTESKCIANQAGSSPDSRCKWRRYVPSKNCRNHSNV